MLGGRSFKVSLLSSAHRALGKQPAPMISELLAADSGLRKPVHLPGLAHETASAPILGPFTLVMGHDL
jgi:hypothetical protein